MVSIRIANVEKKLDEVDEHWIREQLGRRMDGGQAVCVLVTIHVDGVDLALPTPACGGGHGGGRPLTPRELGIVDLWRQHKLDTNNFNYGQVNAFVKQLRHMV